MKRPIILSTLLVLTSALWSQGGPGGGGPGGPGGFGGGGGLLVTATGATQGRVITLGGRITPTRRISHTVTVPGYLDRNLVQVGDRVREGQALLRLSREAIGETFKPVVVESRISGLVSALPLAPGEEVKVGTIAVTVVDDSTLLLPVSVSDRDAQAIRALGPVSVTGKTPEGRLFRGTLGPLSTEPDYTTGLFSLTITFPRQEGLFLGAVVYVDLPVEKPSGLLVQRTALSTQGGQSFLWVMGKDNTLALRPVSLGKPKDTRVEILSGLEAGERYLGKLTGKEKAGMTLRQLIQATMGADAPRRP